MIQLHRLCLLVTATFFVLMSTVITTLAQGNDNVNQKGALDPASTNYIVLDPVPQTGQERVLCLARGSCTFNILTCPVECTQRKPRRNKIVKGCFIDCSSRCETTCKTRLPNCNGYGSVCYDPRFVGGDGVMFYFHGASGGDFALVSDDHLHINGHFIGTRPEGRERDFTWVQSLAVMFDSHTLVIKANKVAKWSDEQDAITVTWDGRKINLPNEMVAEWHTTTTSVGDVVVERTGNVNSIRVTVQGMLEMDVKVTPITEKEDKAHGYHLPEGDAFAHLEMQFKFKNLTDQVEGVLGQTYRPGYVSPAKRGVPMPVIGGEDRYRTTSFEATDCVSCRYKESRKSVNEDQILVASD